MILHKKKTLTSILVIKENNYNKNYLSKMKNKTIKSSNIFYNHKTKNKKNLNKKSLKLLFNIKKIYKIDCN